MRYPDPVVSHTLKHFDQAVKQYSVSSFPSPFTPILNNPNFTPALDKTRYDPWDAGGCTKISDLFSKGLIKSFQECKQHFHLSEKDRFSYFQLRHWTLNQDVFKAAVRDTTAFEDVIAPSSSSGGLISSIYRILSCPQVDMIHPYMLNWERDIGSPISQEQWTDIWTRASVASICTQYKENAYKILYRWYMVPTRLNKIYPATSRQCWRNCGEEGSFFHIWWTCPIISSYWQSIVDIIHSITYTRLPMQPLVILLGAVDADEVYPLRSDNSALISQLLLAARLLLAAHWKQVGPPPLSRFYGKVWDLCAMSKITHTLRGTYPKHISIWFPFISLLERCEDLVSRPDEAGQFSLI